jgi:hypothetical protein
VLAVTALATVAAFPRAAVSSAERPSVAEFAVKVGFETRELAALGRGEVVTRVLKTQMAAANDTAEVAVVGIVRVEATSQAFLEAVGDGPKPRSETARRTGIIHNPPQPDDFAGVEVPDKDVADLKRCRPGGCAVKLPGEGIASLQSSIDWSSPQVREQVNRLVRERLLALMTAYMEHGTAAFKALEDKSTPISIDEQFRHLLDNTTHLIAAYPELAAYLRDYPKATLAGARDAFRWSLDDYGSLKQTLTVTHVVAYVPGGGGDAVVARKLLYASHYFNGGLAITTFAKDPAASYVLQLDRLRADSLGGTFGGVKRGKMADAMETALKRFLTRTQASLGSPAKS